MENGFSASDALLTQAMSGGFGNNSQWGGNGGYGYHLGDQVLASHAHADGTAVKESVDCNRTLNQQGQSSLSQQISDGADRSRDAATLKAISDGFTVVTEKININSEVNAGRFNALEREMSANAREQAKCCCEAKVLAVQNQAKTDAGLATIIANKECADKVATAVANANQNAKLDVLLSKGGNGHG